MLAETRPCLSAASCSCTDIAVICHVVSLLPDGQAYCPGVKPQTADFRESALSMVKFRRSLTQYQSVHYADIHCPSYPTNCFNFDAVEKLFPAVTICALQCDSFVNRDSIDGGKSDEKMQNPERMKKNTKKYPENLSGTSPAQNTAAKALPLGNDVVTTMSPQTMDKTAPRTTKNTPAETSLCQDDIVLTMSPHITDAPTR